MNKEHISILDSLKNDIDKEINVHFLLHKIKPKFLGKNSYISSEMNKLKNISDINEKKQTAKELNILKTKIEEIIKEKEIKLEDLENFTVYNFTSFDKPIKIQNGSLHLVTKTIEEIYKIFIKYGFNVHLDQEIETDFNNFTGLNIPESHPARQMQDTFYLDSLDNNGKNNLLRTHTTCVSLKSALKSKIPIKNASLGKVFRVDSDKTHSPMFHQFELTYIDENVNLSHLKFYLERLLKEFFENEELKIYFRPSYFPFTSPSLEIDINYDIIDNNIRIGTGNKKLEVLGAGFIHKNVLKNMKIDSKKYSGIAFGGGVERLAMLKYGCDDIREFYNYNYSWLNFNSFKTFDV